MPKQMEQRLSKEAQSKGLQKGSKRYNAYVYGTMNKMGKLDPISSNHAGGPEKVFSENPLPGFKNPPNVTVPHILLVTGIIFVVAVLLGLGARARLAVPGVDVTANSNISPDQFDINIARSSQDQSLNLSGVVAMANQPIGYVSLPNQSYEGF